MLVQSVVENFIHLEIWKSMKKEKQDVSCIFDQLVFKKFTLEFKNISGNKLDI